MAALGSRSGRANASRHAAHRNSSHPHVRKSSFRDAPISREQRNGSRMSGHLKNGMQRNHNRYNPALKKNTREAQRNRSRYPQAAKRWLRRKNTPLEIPRDNLSQVIVDTKIKNNDNSDTDASLKKCMQQNVRSDNLTQTSRRVGHASTEGSSPHRLDKKSANTLNPSSSSKTNAGIKEMTGADTSSNFVAEQSDAVKGSGEKLEETNPANMSRGSKTNVSINEMNGAGTSSSALAEQSNAVKGPGEGGRHTFLEEGECSEDEGLTPTDAQTNLPTKRNRWSRESDSDSREQKAGVIPSKKKTRQDRWANSSSESSDEETEDRKTPIESPEVDATLASDLHRIHKQQQLHDTLISGCRSITKFQRLNKIAEGSYGIVFRAMCLDTKRIFALKKVLEPACLLYHIYRVCPIIKMATKSVLVTMSGENKIRIIRLPHHRLEGNKCVAFTPARKYN